MNTNDIARALPCSMNAVSQQNEMVIKGESKLVTELTHARGIPAKERLLINPGFLEMDI